MEIHTHPHGMHDSQEPLDYNYIDDGIYIGTNQCCLTGLSNILKKEGITADISLEDTRLDQPFGVEAYLWIPVKNHTPPTKNQLDLGVKTLKELVRQGHKIYVHCQNGHGRAPTLVAAYFVDQGMSAEKAEAMIKSHRPSMHLEETQRQTLRLFQKDIT